VSPLLFVIGAGAHELGGARVRFEFDQQGGYQAAVVVDLAHVPAEAGAWSQADTLPQLFGESTQLWFDDRPITARWRIAETREDGSVVLQANGRVLGGSREFCWETSAPLGNQILELHQAGTTTPSRQWVPEGVRSVPFSLRHAPPAPTLLQTSRDYLVLGFTHILPKGLDHILFVLGLFLLAKELKPLFWQVTAFTIAHTLTLGLAMIGVVSLSGRIVEPLIAASIVFVAVENVMRKELTRSRLLVVFGFGLLHGLGFAGVLSELGLPRTQFVPALISFNVGVELGQLSVLGLAFAAVGWWAREREWYRPRVTIPASIAIAAVGTFWAIERLVAAG
jgi:hydrogenase/urease accessory protein HupE